MASQFAQTEKPSIENEVKDRLVSRLLEDRATRMAIRNSSTADEQRITIGS